MIDNYYGSPQWHRDNCDAGEDYVERCEHCWSYEQPCECQAAEPTAPSEADLVTARFMAGKDAAADEEGETE